MANWWDEWAQAIGKLLGEEWVRLEQQRALEADGGNKPNPGDSGPGAGKPRRKRKRRTDPGPGSDGV